MDVSHIGRWLLAGAAIAGLAGVIFLLAGRLGLGRLPGDLSFGRGNLRIYLPLATSIVLSVVATIVLNLFFRR
ncbi:MAG: DUF2905 domain-containing protein [Acidimicrobiales bacterium]